MYNYKILKLANFFLISTDNEKIVRNKNKKKFSTSTNKYSNHYYSLDLGKIDFKNNREKSCLKLIS